MFLLSLPMRGAWIEMYLIAHIIISLTSLPMRGAWIEILALPLLHCLLNVAPHAGSVD